MGFSAPLLDLQRVARDVGLVRKGLPCTFHPRIADAALNQVLLGGLRLGSRLTSDSLLRANLAGLCSALQEEVDSVPLDWRSLRRVQRSLTRLTAAYAPVLALTEMLMESGGADVEGDTERVDLPGYLFDMNRLFQALLSRFLSENLPGCRVRDEQVLRGMMAYDPLHNPRHHPVPAPRPDFVVMKGSATVAVLDAKYRDLWANPLPRDMLYQLAVYALSQSKPRLATILYPTLDESATDAHIVINDPLSGACTGRVILRPVNMLRLGRLVAETPMHRERLDFASALAFGPPQTGHANAMTVLASRGP